MAKALASLGGVPLTANPNEIRWNFRMKTYQQDSIGGRVIQILGTTLGDITVRGSFGPGIKTKGDTEGWQAQIRFQKQVRNWATSVQAGQSQPLRFTYTPRNWDFRVFIKSLSPTSMSTDEINPVWEMALFPVDEDAMKVVAGVKDLYIARLADGIGWKQTAYNGPTQAEVDDKLSTTGGSAVDYLRDRFKEAFSNNNAGRPQ